MAASVHLDERSNALVLTTKIDMALDPSIEHSVIDEAIKRMAELYATQWADTNRDKIYERLNVDAISNMIMIEVAKQVKQDITSKEKQL